MYLTFEAPPGTYMVDPSESAWPVPKHGTIRFKFGTLSAHASDILDAETLDMIVQVFLDVEKTNKERIEAHFFFDLGFFALGFHFVPVIVLLILTNISGTGYAFPLQHFN